MLVLEAFCLLFAGLVVWFGLVWLLCDDSLIGLWRRGQTRLRQEADIVEARHQAERGEGKSREEARREVEQAGEAVRRIIEDIEGSERKE